MNKICEKCGNVIPDGADVCPNCGREEYDDTELQNVLNELGIALEAEGRREQAASGIDASAISGDIAEAASDVLSEEPTIRIPSIADAGKRKAESNAAPETAIHKLIEESQSEKNFRAEPAAAKRKNQPDSVQKKRSSGTKTAAASNQKKRKKKKNSSAAAIGVVIGLIIALLIIACGVAFMLYQMGFFATMTDDELLQTPASMQTAAVEQTPVAELPEEVEISVEEPAAVIEEVSAVEAEVEMTAEPEETIECTSFSLIGSEYLILYSRGVTTEMLYVIEPAELSSKIEWESSNELVATVDDFGVIRARRGGECKITGTCGDKSISVYVTCDFTVPDTVLDMNMEDITMSYEGQTVELAIDYELTEEQIAATVWESSDPTVATVNDEGVVTAVSDGTAVITASIADYTASCIVRCVDVTGNTGYNSDASEYVINYEDVTLTRKGEYFQLTLKSVLGNEVPEFTWKSDDTDVATVDSKGVVTAVSDGTAYITTSIGADKFQCIVRVRISD